jgi:hypothetical protein
MNRAWRDVSCEASPAWRLLREAIDLSDRPTATLAAARHSVVIGQGTYSIGWAGLARQCRRPFLGGSGGFRWGHLPPCRSCNCCSEESPASPALEDCRTSRPERTTWKPGERNKKAGAHLTVLSGQVPVLGKLNRPLPGLQTWKRENHNHARLAYPSTIIEVG